VVNVGSQLRKFCGTWCASGDSGAFREKLAAFTSVKQIGFFGKRKASHVLAGTFHRGFELVTRRIKGSGNFPSGGI
jgi:hypothetical protein